MKNYIIISFTIIFFIVAFIVLNKVCGNYTLKEDRGYDIQMTGCNVYYYDKDVKNALLFSFSSDTCDISHNFRNMEAHGNIKGVVSFNNSKFNFNCSDISLAQSEKILSVKNVKAILNKDSYVSTGFGYIDLNSMYMKSPEEIFYKDRNVTGKAQHCYADLVRKVLVLDKTDIEITLL